MCQGNGRIIVIHPFILLSILLFLLVESEEWKV